MSGPWSPGREEEEEGGQGAGDSGFTSRFSGFLGSMLAPVTGLIAGSTPGKGGLLARSHTPVAPTIGFRQTPGREAGAGAAADDSEGQNDGHGGEDDAMDVDEEGAGAAEVQEEEGAQQVHSARASAVVTAAATS